ncbi:hypothetical protein Ahp2_73 [Aeromonas phage Ahp2]|nr:hypothetical protein Ahp2_73 [Aeromonas phage Ahp2]
MKRSNKKLKKVFPFGRIVPLTQFNQMKPGDVMVLMDSGGISEGWRFWMNEDGNVFIGMGGDNIDLECDHNHWLDDQTFPPGKIVQLAAGIEGPWDLRRWETARSLKLNKKFRQRLAGKKLHGKWWI